MRKIVIIVFIAACCYLSGTRALRTNKAPIIISDNNNYDVVKHVDSTTKDNVSTVHVISMNHLDIGFNAQSSPSDGHAYAVINRYFEVYFPRAVNTSSYLRKHYQEERLIYTTHAWLVHMYINCKTYEASKTLPPGPIQCPNATALSDFIATVKIGDITWHAFPHNSEPEFMMNADFVARAVRIAHDLDDYFGFPHKTVMSQRDVPGMTRSIIPILLQSGVKAITVGVNGGSAPPVVPKLFLWKDVVSSQSIYTMYHPGGYGGITVKDCVTFPNFSQALAPVVREDNSGPPPVDEVVSNFAKLKTEFPNAKIMASTWDNFVALLDPIRNQLPVVSSEIGDTWIYGVASDPLKAMQFREIVRARSECIKEKKCDDTKPDFVNFDVLLMKVPEHTWGMDVKTFLNDVGNWTNAQLQASLSAPNFKLIINSWVEQRQYITQAISALGPAHKDFADDLKSRLKGLLPYTPNTSGLTPITCKNCTTDTGSLIIGFDENGLINYLQDKVTKKQWVSPGKGQLFMFQYQLISQAEYTNLLEDYINCNYLTTCTWAYKDFAKPGMPENNDTLVQPKLSGLYSGKLQGGGTQFIVHLSMSGPYNVNAGAPKDIYINITVPSTSSRVLSADVQIFGKTTTRLAESLWVSFQPSLVASTDKWMVDKLGELVDTSDIVLNGSQHIHAINSAVRTDASTNTTMQIHTIDSPIVSVGVPLMFPIPVNKPANQEGALYVNLYNNLWGTNYIMWYPFVEGDENAKYRFQVSFN